MSLWERINLGLECIGIVVLIGFKPLFFVVVVVIFPYSSVFTVAGKKRVCVAISHISVC